MKYGVRALLCLMLLSSVGLAQFGSQMKSAPLAQDKFTSMPGIPACMTLAPANGDPAKGSYVIVLKATAGCVAPWHWHSGDENAMFVAGRGKLETKDGPPQPFNPGDYVYAPAKHPHKLTCVTACTLFLYSAQAFDIHYIDANGNEIPPEQALKASAGRSGSTKKSAGSAKTPSQ